MTELDVLTLIIVPFGIYYVFIIKKTYNEYQRTKGMLDFNTLVRDIGVIFASIVMVIYKLVEVLV
jgi:hypothetical protein